MLQSIRWRLQLWHGLLLIAVTAGLLIFAYHSAKGDRIGRLDAELVGGLFPILPELLPPHQEGRPAPPDRPPRPRRNVELLEASGNYVVAYRPDGGLLHRSKTAPESVRKPETAGEAWTGMRWNGSNRELVHVTPRGDAVIVGAPSGLLQEQFRILAWQLTLIGVFFVVAGLFVGAFISSAALRPLRDIAATARRIAGGEWQERIPIGGGAKELADLAGVLNESFARIEENYRHQARFTADAAHELGNPVAIVLSQTELALAREREKPEYVTALAACRRAGERMRDLTRDLLDLAAYESGLATRQRAQCDLAELAREAVGAVREQAEEKQVLIAEDLPSLPAHVHALSISQALINLLGNAIRHNPPGTRVSIRLWREDDRACFEIADSGPGIPAGALPQIFERFYRIDPSQGEGRGLGLAITKAIVEAHGGSLTAENAGGARFRIILPFT